MWIENCRAARWWWLEARRDGSWATRQRLSHGHPSGICCHQRHSWIMDRKWSFVFITAKSSNAYPTQLFSFRYLLSICQQRTIVIKYHKWEMTDTCGRHQRELAFCAHHLSKLILFIPIPHCSFNQRMVKRKNEETSSEEEAVESEVEQTKSLQVSTLRVGYAFGAHSLFRKLRNRNPTRLKRSLKLSRQVSLVRKKL